MRWSGSRATGDGVSGSGVRESDIVCVCGVYWIQYVGEIIAPVFQEGTVVSREVMWGEGCGEAGRCLGYCML